MIYQTFTIFQKELSGYFKTPLAYFLISAYILISMFSTFYLGAFFVLNNTELFSFFFFQNDIFALLIPALTMRLWAEERRSGTMELLLTQPISYTSVVLGKFFSAWIFCFMLLCTTIPFWIFINIIYQLDNINILSSYIGCFLISGVFCAIGCCISAFNKGLVVAYICTLFLSLIISTVNFDFLIGQFNLSDDVSIRIIQSLNFSKHYNDMTGGQVGFDNIIYYFSMIALPLWLNILTIEYKKN
ncbi:MAG: ABC transporter permease subunit [Alphaproteobacteria bacterium]|nr:ABC transporter permease subunit [Alphaproteobacteria bacterium]